MKTITIIVVNWNSGSLTNLAVKPYLNYQSSKIKCKIVIVDNASNDDSIEIFKKLPVKIIENKINVGFGEACNQAYDFVDSDYILLLNPDTVSSPDVLEGLTDFLEINKAYAITGPQQKYENGTIMKSCGRFPSFTLAVFDVLALSKISPKIFKPAPIMLDFNHLISCDVDQVMGSYMLIKKSVIDQVGFMDREYFVYGEDLDLSKRIAAAGYKSYFNSQYTILHKGGGSGDKVTSTRLLYSISSRNIYWKKHFTVVQHLILSFLSLTAEPLLRIINSPLNTFSILVTYVKYSKKLIKFKF